MKTRSISEIQQELKTLDKNQIVQYCARLIKYKKENKELLSYLLFEALDENAFVQSVKADIDILFSEINRGSVFFIKKTLRKILRYINRSIKYSGIKQTELELRLYYCKKIQEAKLPISNSLVLTNLYNREVEKSKIVFSKLHEDLQFDYKDELEKL
jgi:membrane-anchored protein YejM (alkaline phosphatase superfamily)